MQIIYNEKAILSESEKAILEDIKQGDFKYTHLNRIINDNLDLIEKGLLFSFSELESNLIIALRKLREDIRRLTIMSGNPVKHEVIEENILIVASSNNIISNKILKEFVLISKVLDERDISKNKVNNFKIKRLRKSGISVSTLFKIPFA